ncbi:MAG: 1,4-dihydroxy-2-naphthoate octaprenyltransferase [Candidatus Margulisbacteria bacterium]|nr:1,4-dihydroxy-2-naphthoate octaprenyltransferase [Candidatus Margulisiibacteriota bacterium]
MISHWISATRPKTLPVSLCPVIFSFFLAHQQGMFNALTGAVIIFCVLCIQVGTNFANDYYDFLKGADAADRVGPKRMTQAGLIHPTHMKRAAMGAFSLAICFGGYLVAIGGLPIVFIGLASVFFGLIYTAGPFALAYIGGAEFVSMVFFGPVSVIGATYLHTGVIDWQLWLIGLAFGLITAALLVVNNTRDIESDRQVNKKTFAVRFGRLFSTIEYILFLYSPIVILDYLTEDSTDQMVLTLALVIVAMLLTRRFGKANGAGFNRLLALTSGYLMLFTAAAIVLI